MLTNAPKGTKDLLPKDAYKWHYIEKVFRHTCEKYGFLEIRTPSFEHTELFSRGVGNTTDIVEKQMYTFEDYAKRSITLKPEGTSPAVRAFVEHKQYAEVQPTKYYYDIPCFRYEKPQSGRLREFHQFGIEVFGIYNMLADAEVIAFGHDFLMDLGIKDVELRINSVGCPKCRAKHREALREFLKPKYEQLCDTCKGRFERNPLRVIDCKSEICHELVKGAPHMIDYLCKECNEDFENLQKNLDAMGIPFIIDPGIVRGLDYYTKTAFEFVTNSIGAQGTVCGGGRYNHLIEQLGGPPIPGVGFGLGKERLLLVMEANEIEIPKQQSADIFVAVMGESATRFGLKLLRELRQLGLKAELDLMARNLKSQFKYADRLNVKYVAIIGENELTEGKISLKNMKTSEQFLLPVVNVAEELEAIINNF